MQLRHSLWHCHRSIRMRSEFGNSCIQQLVIANVKNEKMRSSEHIEIVKRQISKKIKKLAELEKALSMNDSNSDNLEFKVTRKVYACFDGFIILRTFSKDYIAPFELFISPDRIKTFIKNQLLIRTKNGFYLKFYEAVNPVINMNWGIGTKLDLGSKGGGLRINQFEIDGLQIMIFDYNEIDQIKETLDDIKFIMYSDSEIQKLSEENVELKKTVSELNSVTAPLIISEGKTDWKYFLSALRFFKSKNQFEEIEEKWFLRFGSQDDITNDICETNFDFENSVSKLNKLLDSFYESRRIDSNIVKSIRIGIFDSDNSQAKIVTDNENEIYSFEIQPKNISTELLFSDTEIKSIIDGKRLYIGNEFNDKSKRLTENSSFNLGGDNNNLNKAGKNVIIDSDVYNDKGINVALTKEKFAQQIYNGNIKISEESWEKFRHVFDKILEYIRK